MQNRTKEINPYIYASIDAGQKGYICLWEKDFLGFQTFPMPLMKGKKFIDGHSLEILLSGVERVYIEKQFTLKNQKGMITNIMNYGIAYHSALCITDKVIEVPATKWVTDMGLSNRGRNPLLGKLTKNSRIGKVYALTGYKPKTHDEADSILIGIWVFNNKFNNLNTSKV